MGTIVKIFLLGVALAGGAIVARSRMPKAGPAMQDDAGNPAPS